MPIRPDLRRHYRTAEWREARDRVLERANHCCEECGAPNRKTVLGCMQWWTPLSLEAQNLLHSPPSTVIELPWQCTSEAEPKMLGFPRMPHMRWRSIQLGVAHLDHNPENNTPENLKALCRRCHLVNDKYHHRESRAKRKDRERPVLALLMEGVA